MGYCGLSLSLCVRMGIALQSKDTPTVIDSLVSQDQVPATPPMLRLVLLVRSSRSSRMQAVGVGCVDERAGEGEAVV